MRARFFPRLLEADPNFLLNEAGENLDPPAIRKTLVKNEKPGGHGGRSMSVGTIDRAVWGQLIVLGVLMFTSKGSAGVTGAGFVTLAATLASMDKIPVAGMVLLLGITGLLMKPGR